MARRLFLIDSFGFIFRAYHARARSGAPPMRTGTGLSTEAVYIFNNMVRKLQKSFHPDWIAAIFESEGPTLREQEFKEYKATRAETPPDLLDQIPLIRRLLDALRIPVLDYRGYEADDVIGTMSRRAAEQGIEVVVVSSDKDMLQLVDERVSMLNPAKDDAWYDPDKVREFMGVRPDQVADLLALKGDSVDNIPGAPGIGDKGAKDLIERFGSVEAALERASEVERKAYRESLRDHREQILLSKKLATISCDVPIEYSLDELAAREPDLDSLKQIYKELEFHSLLRELGPSEDTRTKDYGPLEAADLDVIPRHAPLAVAIHPGEPGTLDLPGLGLAWKPGMARAAAPPFSEPLRALLEDAAWPKIACDIKATELALERYGVHSRGFADDVMLYAFLLDADPGACSLEDMAQRRLDLKLGASPEQQADCVLELNEQLRAAVDARGLRSLYETMELPFTGVLARMESTGILVDPAELGRLSGLMQEGIERLTAEVYELAGKPFNLNSPQQLGKVLFEDLGLPAPVRYGKGKTISTAAGILEDLAPDYPIVAKVLEYRQLAKLKGTYVDALPTLIDPGTGRLHTTFNQAGSATGRLSSSNPNLQNIPIRSELGREIRAAFVPRPGWKLVVADYSQIELRLLAHFSGDPVLVESFVHGEDIHTRTAAEVFGIAPLMVTAELRRNAKAVNFGIVYGISGFGLAAQLGIPRAEAEKYIKSYFQRYAGVKRFIDSTIAEVRRTGVTRTLFGRERPIPDINSRNPNARGFAERTAVNSPLQGTAADLIKLAMIRIDQRLTQEGAASRMLLQVHDELLFESPPEELDALTQMVKREMEQVHALKVPLVADVGAGDNWRDAK
ncbi:MAG: DNA polymerase I [Candidatus Solibacter usitatus]|nr:DNA polymerase I [Candidatus Solibacter usitatus]